MYQAHSKRFQSSLKTAGDFATAVLRCRWVRFCRMHINIEINWSLLETLIAASEYLKVRKLYASLV